MATSNNLLPAAFDISNKSPVSSMIKPHIHISNYNRNTNYRFSSPRAKSNNALPSTKLRQKFIYLPVELGEEYAKAYNDIATRDEAIKKRFYICNKNENGTFRNCTKTSLFNLLIEYNRLFDLSHSSNGTPNYTIENTIHFEEHFRLPTIVQKGFINVNFKVEGNNISRYSLRKKINPNYMILILKNIREQHAPEFYNQMSIGMPAEIISAAEPKFINGHYVSSHPAIAFSANARGAKASSAKARGAKASSAKARGAKASSAKAPRALASSAANAPASGSRFQVTRSPGKFVNGRFYPDNARGTNTRRAKAPSAAARNAPTVSRDGRFTVTTVPQPTINAHHAATASSAVNVSEYGQHGRFTVSPVSPVPLSNAATASSAVNVSEYGQHGRFTVSPVSPVPLSNAAARTARGTTTRGTNARGAKASSAANVSEYGQHGRFTVSRPAGTIVNGRFIPANTARGTTTRGTNARGAKASSAANAANVPKHGQHGRFTVSYAPLYNAAARTAHNDARRAAATANSTIRRSRFTEYNANGILVPQSTINARHAAAAHNDARHAAAIANGTYRPRFTVTTVPQ